MQVKYIVYYRENNPVPEVDIWQTTGEIIHSLYARKNNIVPQNISSQGYLYFHLFFKRWLLEHYQMDDTTSPKTLKELFQKRNLEKRDRLLVKKKAHRTPFLKDEQLQKETWADKKKINALCLYNLLFPQNH